MVYKLFEKKKRRINFKYVVYITKLLFVQNWNYVIPLQASVYACTIGFLNCNIWIIYYFVLKPVCKVKERNNIIKNIVITR